MIKALFELIFAVADIVFLIMGFVYLFQGFNHRDMYSMAFGMTLLWLSTGSKSSKE